MKREDFIKEIALVIANERTDYPILQISWHPIPRKMKESQISCDYPTSTSILQFDAPTLPSHYLQLCE